MSSDIVIELGFGRLSYFWCPEYDHGIEWLWLNLGKNKHGIERVGRF